MFWCPIDEVQPSQTYLSRKLLDEAIRTVEKGILKPFPVREMDGRLILLDGHHTAYALFLMGFAFIPCMLYDSPIDMDMYRWAVKWAMDEGIERIGHLGKRIVEHGDFVRLWVGACEEYKRKRRGNSR